ncbi:MAG: YkvA family protein [Pseudomonadota bacterium]
MNVTANESLPLVLSSVERRRFWAKLKRLFGTIPFARDLLAAYYCATDKATPQFVRVTLVGALVYFLVPTDTIPDIIAGLGFVDDASVLAAALSAVRQYLRPRHFDAADSTLDELRGDQSNA